MSNTIELNRMEFNILKYLYGEGCKNQYHSMTITEPDINPSIIEEISVDEDGTITLTFDGGAYLPDLEINYRD